MGGVGAAGERHPRRAAGGARERGGWGRSQRLRPIAAGALEPRKPGSGPVEGGWGLSAPALPGLFRLGWAICVSTASTAPLLPPRPASPTTASAAPKSAAKMASACASSFAGARLAPSTRSQPRSARRSVAVHAADRSLWLPGELPSQQQSVSSPRARLPKASQRAWGSHRPASAPTLEPWVARRRMGRRWGAGGCRAAGAASGAAPRPPPRPRPCTPLARPLPAGITAPKHLEGKLAGGEQRGAQLQLMPSPRMLSTVDGSGGGARRTACDCVLRLAARGPVP